MLEPIVMAVLVFVSMEFIIGVTANGLILVVSILGCSKQRSVGPSELILGSLASTRLVLQCLLIINYVYQVFGHEIENSMVHKLFVTLWMCATFSSIWCATWLCVFYCVKVATFRCVLFAWLKRRFSKLLPFLLLGSMLMSLAFSLPLFANINTVFGETSTSSSNYTAPPFTGGIDFQAWSILCALGSSVPFVLFLVAATLLITSLWRHSRRMKGNDVSGFRSPSLKAHRRAIESMAMFFFFFTCFIVTVNISASRIVAPQGWQGSVCAAVISAYPSLHSVVLILANGRLKDGCCRLLPGATRFLEARGVQQAASICT